MRTTQAIALALLALAASTLACGPRQGLPRQVATRKPPLTRARADAALKTMLVSHPKAFWMTDVRLQPDETDRFVVLLDRAVYRVSIHSGACVFDYEGTLEIRDGAWRASEPSLRAVGKVHR